MRRGLLLVSLVLLFAQPLSAQAGDKYIGIMAGSTTYKEPGYKFKVNSAAAKFGYRFNNFLATEVHGGIGGSDTANSITFDLNYMTSAFLRADWSPRADNRVRLYLLAGVTAADFEFSSGTANVSSTESGFSYALGIDLLANLKHGLYFQWGRYLDDTSRGADYTLDNTVLGYIRYF